MEEVEERTEGSVALGPGTLYGALKRMRSSGLIEELHDGGKGAERRRTYRLTDFGLDVARAEARRLKEAVRSAGVKNLLGESP